MEEEKRLPLRTRIFYGAGVSYAIVDQIFAQWILYFYLPPESSGLKALLPPLLLSIALSITRVVDAVTDPLIGYLSDKTETRWGRRVPYIAFGTIPLSVMTIAFFYPLKGSDNITFLYLTLIGSLFFLFYTIVGGPYNSLIPEIGNTKEERLSLSTWQSVFRLLYSAIAVVAPGMLIKYFGAHDTVRGIRGMVITLSVVSALGAGFTIFGVNEKKLSKGGSAKLKFFSTLKILIKNRSFTNYLFGLLFFFTGFNMIRATMNYYIEDIMGYGKSGITIAAAIFFAASALCFYPVSKLSKKYGYRKMMLISLVIYALLSILMAGLGKYFHVKYGYVIFALMGVATSGAAFIYPPAMLSELGTKISEELNERIEGVCFGIQGFFLKLAFLISIFILPIILAFGNNDKVGKFGIYMSSVVAALFFILSFIFYYRYEE